MPFEREQFEEYLNTLYLDCVHLVAGKHVVECEETSIRFYYRVAYFPKNKQEQEDIKETYKKFGYDYVGEIHHFGIFESLENHPVFINEMIEEEMLMPIVKKEWIKNVIGLPLGLIAIIMFYYYFS